jgi:hypothetical protein
MPNTTPHLRLAFHGLARYIAAIRNTGSEEYHAPRESFGAAGWIFHQRYDEVRYASLITTYRDGNH